MIGLEENISALTCFVASGSADPMECGSYRGIKLLEHAMKVVERIFEHRIRQQIKIDDMQFGFMKGEGTTDAIFMARQMQENFRVKGKKLYFGFVDLEKAFDRVPRDLISWAMRKLRVEEWLVSAVMSMCIIIIIIHEYYYGGAVALLLQDHLTMSVSRFAGYKTCPGVNSQGNTP